MGPRILKSKRVLFDLTQEEIAKELGITIKSYNAKENGKREFTLDEAKKISNYLRGKLSDKTSILGPSIANVLRINNLYNFQVILKYKKDDNLYNALNEVIKVYEGNSKIKIELDFDPVNL